MIDDFGRQSYQMLQPILTGIGDIHPLTLIFTVITGAASGYLINYLADVLPETRRFSQPQCPECETPYNIKDYLLLRKCPECSQKRSLRTYTVLVGTVLISILLQIYPFANLSYLATLPLMIFLGTVLVIDIEHRLVLIETSILGVFLCLVYGLLLHNPYRTLLGGLNGLLIMLFFFVLGIIFSFVIGKVKGKTLSEVAFGFGDVFAGTFLGLLTGWPGILGAIIMALLIFVVFSVVLLLVLIITKRYRAFTSAQPFVPFLILGAVIMFYM